MKRYIVDSSLILELFLVQDEDILRIANFIADETIKLYSSLFLKLEVSNVLTKRLGNLQLSQSIYQTFLSMPIEYIELDDITIKQAQIMASSFNASVYDASYHALAIANSITLITMDKRYYNCASEIGNIELFK